ncbi:MAG TPA: hypothetical protein VH540_12260 [Ktedonobacterales bacterium]
MRPDAAVHAHSRKACPHLGKPLPSFLRPGAAALVFLCAWGLLAGLAPGPAPAQASQQRPFALTCNGPCVGITNPVYDGKAEGPVGAHLTVEAANWPPSSKLTIWPGLDAAACAGQPPGNADTLNVDITGSARDTYDWPLTANKVNQTYLLCASDGTTVLNPTVQVNAPGSYTVLADTPASISIAPNTINEGANVTISGRNWLPAQSLTIMICANTPACTSDPPVVTRSLNSGADGTFNIQPLIPLGTRQGLYYVVVTSGNGALTAPASGAGPNLSINTLPTPTPTATATPLPTPTPTPPSTGGKGGGTTLLIVVLGTLSLLFLIGGIVSMIIYVRSLP